MTTDIKAEVTMELLGDLATAVRNVMAQTVPSLALSIRVEASPRPAIVITVEDSDPVYGQIIKARAEPLRLTNEGRRLLGLPVGG